jgi:hypothetical protein
MALWKTKENTSYPLGYYSSFWNVAMWKKLGVKNSILLHK